MVVTVTGLNLLTQSQLNKYEGELQYHLLLNVFNCGLNSKDPPKTFVAKILVAQIRSFQGLHQLKPGQK